MDLNDYLAILNRRRGVILRTFILTLALVSVGAFFVPMRHTASAVLRLETISSGSVEWLNYELEYTDRLMNTYVEVASSGALRDQLIESLGGEANPDVSVDILTATELLNVSARADTAEAAAATANAFAQLLIAQETEGANRGRENVTSSIERQLTALSTQIADLQASSETPANAARLQLLNERYDTLIERLESSQVSAALRTPPALRLVSAADPADASTGTNPITILLPLGIVLGLVGGIGLAFLSENLDPTLHNRAQIEQLSGAPILGQVPDRGHPKELLINDAGDARAFKQLLESIGLLSCAGEPCKVLGFSSAEAQAGKSTVVANLGYIAARAGQKVLIIDANLASPSMHSVYHLNNDEGFANLIAGEAPLRSRSLIQLTQVPSLSVLTSGSQALARGPFGASRQLERLAKLREHYDLVLLDCSTILDVGGTLSLAKHCDALLLVVARGHTQREELVQARQRLELAQVQMRGVIVNYATA